MSRDLWGTNCGKNKPQSSKIGRLKKLFFFFNDSAEHGGLEVLIIGALCRAFCLGEATASEKKCLQKPRPLCQTIQLLLRVSYSEEK